VKWRKEYKNAVKKLLCWRLAMLHMGVRRGAGPD